jgi:hypothetical protein
MPTYGYVERDYTVDNYLVSVTTEGEIMSDFNGAKPVQTVRDDEFKIKLVSGESGAAATHALSIVAEGDSITAGVNDRGVLAMVKDSTGAVDVLEKDVDGGLLVHLVNGVTITATDLDIRDLSHTQDSVKVGDGTDFLAVNADGSINAVVTATNLDVRDLAFATDKVDVSGSSVTVSATDLDIRDLNSATDSVTVVATNLDVRDLAFATDKVDVSGSSVTVSATDLDIRNLVAATDSVTAEQGTSPWVIGDLTYSKDTVKIADAAGQVLNINADGSINVVMQPEGGADVLDYKTTATVGANTVTNHDYIVPNALTFTGSTVLVGARGAVKVEVGTWDGTTFAPKFVYFQDPKENRTQTITKLNLLGDGTKAIRVRITNLDGASSDVYSTLQGDNN